MHHEIQPLLTRTADSSGRVLHFVRHGQWEQSGLSVTGPADGDLTALGQEQARAVGRYLARWPVQAVISSDLRRALQTAELLAKELGTVAVQSDPLLRELVSVPAEGGLKSRLDRAYERCFRPAETVCHEVIVAHGNLIRALVCCALKVDRKAWTQMRIHHAGLTRFAVSPDGSIALLSYNETAHLPAQLISET